jgi:ATP-dependent DNA helicase RecG
MLINAITISTEEALKLLLLPESHFCDLKAVDIAPAKLTKTISALSKGRRVGGDGPRAWPSV